MNNELEIAKLKKDWAENPRWKNIKRGYCKPTITTAMRSSQ